MSRERRVVVIVGQRVTADEVIDDKASAFTKGWASGLRDAIHIMQSSSSLRSLKTRLIVRLQEIERIGKS